MSLLPAATLGGPDDPANVAIAERNAALRSEIRLVRQGFGDADALMRALAESVLYVPLVGGPDAGPGLACVEAEGVVWVLGFTDLAELAAYQVRHGDADGPCDYLTVVGSRLLRVAMSSGLALDVAGEHPVMFPPEVE